MLVNVAVSGRFHYHNYVRYLEQAGVLNRFYYSHKLNTTAAVLGIDKAHAVNGFVKEYLTHLHLRMVNLRGIETARPFYRELWQMVALAFWRRCDLLHLMLHGSGRRLIRRAKSERSQVLGEPVNVHPEMQNRILNEEYDRLKIRQGMLTISLGQSRILQEIEMVDELIVASHFLKRSYIDKGYPGEKIHVLPYGVDLSRFRPAEPVHNSPTRLFRIICVGGISARKGHIDLLEAFKQLALPDAELLLIGRVDNKMQPVLARYDGLYRHLPFVPNEQLRTYFTTSSVFVLPSLEDGFGLVVAEAMACGLPIIATHNTGAAEYIEEGVSGYKVDIRAPEQIAARIQELYYDRRRCREMGNAAFRTASESLTWNAYANQLVNLYKFLLGRNFENA
jgi:glycosyltransferase involved in cell wall biosynthesis